MADVQKSAAFYESIFSVKRAKPSNEHVAFLKLGGVVLSLFGRQSLAEDAHVDAKGAGFRAFTLAYNARSESEVDDTVKFIESKGGKVVKPPQKVFWGGYSGYVSDPDGNLLEIAFNPFFPLNERGEIEI